MTGIIKPRSGLRPPFWYFGGKSLWAREIIALFPPHKIYAEPFGGSAAVLLAKPPSEKEVYNDLDKDVVNFFRIIRYADTRRRLLRHLSWMPYSRTEWQDAKAAVITSGRKAEVDYTTDASIKRAAQWFVLARQSFSGMTGVSWALAVNSPKVPGWRNAIRELCSVGERMLSVSIENKDFRDFLKIYASEDTLFYLDPPYLPEARRWGLYACEMSAGDHEELLQLITTLPGMYILSGYGSKLYENRLSAWQRREFDKPCHAVARTKASGYQGANAINKNQRRIEVVWLSPNIHKQLQLFSERSEG